MSARTLRLPPTHSSEAGPPPFEPHGRADLHVHTMASDGVSTVEQILAFVEEETDLDVIAIADHERVDAAHAARAIAAARGYRFEVIVGEEVTTRGGHLLALFIEEPIRPLRSLRDSIAQVHEQGGLAIPAHPLFPYPLCAPGWLLRRLIASADPRVRPDAIEAFNPTTVGRYVHRDVVRFAAEHNLPVVGNSDAHEAHLVGVGWTTFPGSTAGDVRAAIMERRTGWHGSFHGTVSMLPTLGRQFRKYGRDIHDEIGGRVRRDGTRRDLGFPGGRLRPAVLDPAALERASRKRTAP
jgi:predicted metal-dependent phosphoesterase TrpH